MDVRKKWILAVTIIMAIALLLPCLSFAGSLEPTPDAVDPAGNPMPTMKTLNEIPPTWSKKLPCDSTTNCPRFEVLADFNNEAVLDKETGLVWEKYPMNTYGNWYEMKFWCVHSHTGGRDGWRLPTIYELSSLSEYWANEPHWLSCGHPFLNLQGDYW